MASADTFGTGADPADRDADGMRGELGRGPFAAMIAHLALLEMPVVEPLIQSRQLPPASAQMLAPTTTSFADDFQRGRQQFHQLGCAGCHVPMMVSKSPVLAIDGLPPIDLARDMRRPALTYDPSVGGYPVWLFSDLRRHDMGRAIVAKHVQRGVAPELYLDPAALGRRRTPAPTCTTVGPRASTTRSPATTARAAARQATSRSTPGEEPACVLPMSLHRLPR